MIADKFSIREQNEILVLSTIIHHPDISRSSISQMTGLNKASTSDIVKKLLEDKVILETGPGTSSSVGGRKPILLQLNSQAGCSLSIDLGYDYLSSILTNLNGDILVEKKESGVVLNKSNVLSKIKQLVHQYESLYTQQPFQLVGLTIAVHGIVHENKILFTPYSDLEQFDLAGKLEKQLGIPVYLENEANLSVLGETAFSHFQKSMISVSIHSGVGAGIIIEGELYHGSNGQGGEIGHMIIQPKGKKCPCGNKGCMEQYCSQIAILKEYRRQKGDSSLQLTDLAEGFAAGETVEARILEEAALYIAIGMNNLIAHFDPEIIFLNSELFREMPFLLELIRSQIHSKFARNTQLILSEIGEQATLLGGAVINLQNFFRLSRFSFIRKSE